MAGKTSSDMPKTLKVDHKLQKTSDFVVTDSEYLIFQWVFMTVIVQGINVFGIGTNIINVICFVRQGFLDPVNVSLFGLAIFDLCSLITFTWSNICASPVIGDADLPFDPTETQYLISGIPHTAFARVTGWITALIALERCFCVTMPLKINNIVTTRRVSVAIMCVFIINIGSTVPIYLVNTLENQWDQVRNRTRLRLAFKENREDVEINTFTINGVISMVSFLVILICTIILVLMLHRQSKWRKKSTGSEKIDKMSNRNLKVAKMVIVISLVFIGCFVPINIVFLVMTQVPGLSINGKHRTVLIISASCGIMLESVNSSVNIFVYYHMSSNYRKVLRALFFFKESKEDTATNF